MTANRICKSHMATLRKPSCRMEPETNLKFCNTYLYQFTIALQKSQVPLEI
jgi:hypothetical protein